MHPKTEIGVDPQAIKRILANGWWGQIKIHGHRAQIHIAADPKVLIQVYTRQGKSHARSLSPLMAKELRRLFAPAKDWSVIEAEWLKSADRLYLFDFIKREGVFLDQLSYDERWHLLPRDYISPVIETLPILRTVEACLAVLDNPAVEVEGLVFKSSRSPGFSDSSIIRCRKKDRRT